VTSWGGRSGTTYENTYAWFLTVRGGAVVTATAFFDSVAFDELWSGVTPSP
jgi:ketosteroid isomerase-like protein